MANTRHGKLSNIVFAIFFIIIMSVIAKNIYIKHKQIRELSKESSLIDKQISYMSVKIKQMNRDIKIAKSDPHVIQNKAKDNLMMIDKNESIMIFKDK